MKLKTSLAAIDCACAAWLLLLLPLAADAIEFTLPIDCEIGRTCAIQHYVDHDRSPNARDYLCGSLTYDGHNGTDFRLPTMAAQRAGVNVLAAADGEVLRLRDSMSDVSISTADAPTIADRECGNGLVISSGDGWETQYCHLAKGSLRVKKGDRVVAGQPLGRVGLSGKTEFPHLHFTVRRGGQVVDPFAFGIAQGECGGGTSLWRASIRSALTYRERAILNASFADAPVTMERIDSGDVRPPSGPSAPALVAFVRAIGLKTNDIQQLSIRAPDGQIIATHTEKPLDRNKAQVIIFVGKKRPPAGWPTGQYQASYSVTRESRIVLEERFVLSF